MTNDSFILLTFLIPLLGGLGLFLGGLWPSLMPSRKIQPWALVFTFAALATGLSAAVLYPKNRDAFQSPFNIPWLPQFGPHSPESGIHFSFGIFDSISLWMVILTVFLMPLVVMGSASAVKERHREFYAWLLILEAAMIGAFLATDVIFFYVCFEFTLVPLYFLIGIFGSTQRLKAARVFFLFTFTGSMLTLAGVLYVAWRGGWHFNLVGPGNLYDTALSLSLTEQRWVLLALLAGFAVKVPLWPVHTWLPLAHTEAPTAGSVVLAGVLLKLGTYGLLRFALPLCPDAMREFAPALGVLAIIGILYTGLICWVQKDLKKLIAYSSVSHLGFCVLGIVSLNVYGGVGAVMYMINHGLSTGALFLCVGMIYERFHTRDMQAMQGLAKVMPVWSFFFVFFALASVGLPGLNGFVGEFLTLLGAFEYGRGGALGPGYAFFAGVGMIIGAIYILYMVGKVVWGPLQLPAHDEPAGQSQSSGQSHTSHAGHQAVTDLSTREIATLVPLAVACLVLGLFPTLLLKEFHDPVQRILSPSSKVVMIDEVKEAKPPTQAGLRQAVKVGVQTSGDPRAITQESLEAVQ